MIRLIASLAFSILLIPRAFAANELLIDPQALGELMQSKGVVVLDARSADDYQKGHLPGARNLPFSKTFENLSQNGRIPPLPQAQALFSTAGLRKTDLVVAYDDGRLVQASRLLWMLEVYGHDKVKLLDGGIKAWQQAGKNVSQAPAPFAATEYVPTINPRRLATRITTLVASRKPEAYVILDARANPHYEGLESEALRFGHIPQAKNIAISHNLSADGLHLKSRPELVRLYQDVPKDKKIITYCSIGLASSLEYLVLRELGYDVANYDASWKEWGNDPSLPIVNPAEADTKPH